MLRDIIRLDWCPHRTEEQRIEDMKLIGSPEHQTPWT
jgi:hypothetical protein